MTQTTIKVKDNYYDEKECHFINNECSGKFCNDNDNVKLVMCKDCQCYYCTYGICIDRKEK